MKTITTIAFLCFSLLTFAQVGVGNTDPKASLDISASNTTTPTNEDGILIPRIANFPTTNPGADQDGMMVFYTGTALSGKGFYYWDNGSATWVSVVGTKNTLDQAYDEGGAGVGKNIDASDGAVRINGTDGFLVTGTFGNGNSMDTEITGNGVRMFFSPNNAAFRAGWADGNQWDATNIGDYSFATGRRSLASGDYSAVFGYDNVATGTASFAAGLNGGAQGDFAASFGEFSYANGENSFAAGYQNVASGNSTIALGFNNDAIGDFSVSLGRDNSTNGERASTIGSNNLASGDYSTAIGYSSDATALGSVAIGYGTTASGSFATALGQLNTASGNNSFTAGASNVASGNHSVGLGNNNTASGQTSTSFGQSNTASGATSLATGINTIASGAFSSSFGVDNSAPSYAETIIGSYGTTYSTTNSNFFNSADRIFTIGNGQNDTNRSNALIIYKSGLMNINDEYNMPLTDGTNGQVMTTDGAGNITFQDASQDADWHEVGTTSGANNINDNIFTQGNVGIGSTTPNASLDISYSGTQTNGISLDYTQTSASNSYGQRITAETTSTGFITGLQTILQNSNSSSLTTATSVANNANGDENVGISTVVNGNGDNNTGISTVVSGASDENIGGYFSVTSGGIINTGIFATASGGGTNWAGYFGNNAGNGNVYVNDLLEVASAFRYTDGNETLGYILSSNANGDASWVDPSSVFTNTDNQNLTAASLTGTTLNLGIQNGTGTSIDLGVLQDGTGSDNQNIENLSLNGSNILTVDIENGTADTVDLSTLDQSGDVASNLTTITNNTTNINANTTAINNHIANDADTVIGNEVITAATLNGTDLEITEAGSTTTVDLSSLNDSGTDNQNIQNLSLNASNILTVGIEDGGSDTVNLSSLDQSTEVSTNATAIANHIANDVDTVIGNEVITTATLNGTDLEITEAGSLTTVDLSLLQDGTGNDWNLAGNAGTNPSTDFIGTTDNESLSFRTNNTEKLRLTTKGQLEYYNTGRSVFIGYNAGSNDDLSDNENVFIGELAGQANTSGSSNTFVGYRTGLGNQTGLNNIAIGSGALVTNTSGSNNIALGTQSNFNGSGSRNITMGFDSGNNLGTGNDNIIIGNQAGNRDNLTSSQNVYIGSFAGGGTVNNGNPPYFEKTGNVFIGHNAGRYQTDSNRLFIENSDSNTPLLYGEFDNDILRANGTLQVGDPSGSGYAFPTNDGTNGQVMTTNGTGVVTFQDLPTYTDTDDQQIDTFNFNSSTNVLTLELEDDGQVAQTVDLSNLNPTKAVARILMSAGQTNTGAGTTKVNFDTRDFDIGGNFNLTNDNYVVPADGLYRVTAQVTADNSTGTGIFSVRIRVNGGQVRRAEFNHTGSGQVVRQVTSILNLTAGQTVDVAFSRPAVGATILANGGLTFFEIEQL